jgi:tRNA/tmRNA/rRNA uracil-C5-methylase (TrmA/RlmC/RlmD family)
LTKFFPVVPSPKVYHYRNRLDLKLVNRKGGHGTHIGFSSKEPGPVLEVDSCPIAMEPLSDFIPQLRREAQAKIPRDYRMANLTVRCGQTGDTIRWGGIGQKSLRLDARDYFHIDILGRRIFYGLDTFFQANLSILPVIIDFLRAQPIWSKDANFFDLYGGVGLFGLCVNDLVGSVANIEENVHSARMAKYNVSANSLNNIQVHEGRVEDVLPGLLASSAGVDNIVMVDPARAGLSTEALALLNTMPRVKHLIYLSCNPASLAENLKVLSVGGWAVDVVRGFDFFPRTRHVETLAILRKG